jgi:predicted nucleic acid-binding protein
MFSIDTNILLHAFNEEPPSHEAAYGWILSVQHEDRVSKGLEPARNMSVRGGRERLRALLFAKYPDVLDL